MASLLIARNKKIATKYRLWPSASNDILANYTTYLTPHRAGDPEHKRLAWSATHDDARCYVKYINSKTTPQDPTESYIACLSLTTGAYVYMLWHV